MARELNFVCPLPNGMHARPATAFAEIAEPFASAVTLVNARTNASADAKSVLGLISADVRLSDPCVLRIEGADEATAEAALAAFVRDVLPTCDEALPETDAPGDSGPAVRLPRALAAANSPFGVATPVSRGIGIGRAVRVGGMTLPTELAAGRSDSPADEQAHVNAAATAVRQDLQSQLKRPVAATERAILKAHLAILQDPALLNAVGEQTAAGASAAAAVVRAGERFMAQLNASASAYIRERAVDVQDLCIQLLEHLGVNVDTTAATPALTSPAIVIAENLAPRQLLGFDRAFLKGLVLGHAGTTSHAVILARSLGIPTVVNVPEAVSSAITDGQELAIDADRGLLLSSPNEAAKRFYERELQKLAKRRAMLEGTTHAPAKTADGRHVEIAANVGTVGEVAPAVANGADGVGLFRTEMIFIGRDNPPTEQEQYDQYVEAIRAAAGRPIILRTIDVGGDKPLPYLNIPAESNPFLGFRGVRMYREFEPLIRAQLTAIIRASAEGPVRVMIPMVTTIDEVRWVRSVVTDIQITLRAAGTAFDPLMQIGIMVEVPAVAMVVDQFCSEVDFFSIGTNDLAQYTLAVDRENAKIAALSTPRHPSFLRLLKQIVDAARAGGRWIGMCGEMAGSVAHLPLLIALGLDELSMAATEIPAVKATLAKWSTADCQRVFDAAVQCRSVEEVSALLQTARPDSAAPAMLVGELIAVDSDSRSKEEAIQEAIDLFDLAGRAADAQVIEQAVWDREAVYSTGLGYGIAIPHCKTDAINASSIAIVRLNSPVEWGAADGVPVRVVILLATRASETGNAHMKVFSKLARKLMHDEFREQLLGATTAEAIQTLLTEQLEL